MSDVGGGAGQRDPPRAADVHRTQPVRPGRDAPRALLIQPPVYDFALYDLFHQPFGLLRIGRWLESAGYEVSLLDGLDARAKGRRRAGCGRVAREVRAVPEPLSAIDRDYARYGVPESVLRAGIRQFRPDVALVTTGMTYWYQGVAEVGRILREELPGVPVIGGGIYASLMPDHCRAQLTTEFVVTGPADSRLGQILASLGLPVPEGGVPYVPSVELRAASSRLTEAASIRLQEGCPFRCAYCASPVISSGFINGDPFALAGHVADLNRHFGMRTFAFYDDALLHRAEAGIIPFLLQILSEFPARTLSFYLPNAVHLESVTGELADLMFRAGFDEIRFGLESTSAEFHEHFDSKLRIDRIQGAVQALRGAGFSGNRITAYVLMGLPGQRLETVLQTLADAAEMGIRASVAEYSPVPGTPLFAKARDESALNLDTEPLYHNNSVFPLLSGFVSPQELHRVRSVVREMRATVGPSTGSLAL